MIRRSLQPSCGDRRRDTLLQTVSLPLGAGPESQNNDVNSQRALPDRVGTRVATRPLLLCTSTLPLLALPGKLASAMDKDNAFACARMHAMHSAHAASSGSSYQLILEHILSYPGSYEIPLRTMYTLNSAPRAQPLPPALTRSGTPSPTSSAASSPTTPQHAWQESHAAATHFTSSLMAQISQLPTQPCSLPPSFVTAFNRRCFLSDIRAVDFPQALTALDYLKDLETRRRKEVVAALQRLSIDRKTLETDADRIARTHPGSVAWLKALGEKERKVEALYTQLYVGLRRFVSI